MEQQSWLGHSLNGRYKIEALLGQGGMSAVYKAYDPNLLRTVAIKLIHSHLSSDEDFIRRFKQEAAAVAAFRHPNIVQVYDFNIDGSVYYMVLEYIPGQSVQERLKELKKAKSRMPVGQAVRIIIEMCEALGYAHKRGTIHRDIKPANIMLDPQGQAILMDFGIVKIVGATTHTAAGAVVGTARYMSPEVIRGEPLDERSDIYSLGVTLFEMLSGEPPFDAHSAIALLVRHLNDPVPDINAIRPEAPLELSRILWKALEKERENRYHSAGEMASDLRHLLAMLDTAPVLEAVLPPRAESTRAVEPSSVQPGSSTEQWTESQPLHPQELSFLGERPAPDAPGESEAGLPAPLPLAGSLDETSAEAVPSRPGMGFFDKSAVGASPSPSGENLSDRTQLAASPPAAEKTVMRTSPPAADKTMIAAPRPKTAVASPYATIISEPVSRPVAAAPTYAESIPQAQRPAAAPILKFVGAGLMLVFFFIIILSLGGWYVFRNFFPASVPPTATATSTPPAITATVAVIVASTEMPTLTPTLESTATITPTVTATLPPLYVRINGISINTANNYVVEYETFGYTESLPGMHIHFFFDTVSVEQAGSPGSGPWKLYGGPRPFSGYRASDRPAGATQLCALVANANHTIIPGSGNCFQLP